MTEQLIKDIVIVGGGTAGWMTACALATVLPVRHRIRLIESDAISTIGVGEASIPSMRAFNELVRIDESEFMRQTQGTFKLGIEFRNWGKPGESYVHGFGRIGRDQIAAPFYQYWLKMRQQGKAPSLDHFSINTLAPRTNKFMLPLADRPTSPLADIAYAFHFDAGLYAKYLRMLSEQRGVTRLEGRIVDTTLAHDGAVAELVMESGERVKGDFFIDCSGMVGLLIEKALKTGYEDWTHWLPCDSAIAVPTANAGPLTPYTRSTARAVGWQWRIPLQHRMGNGYVYSSQFIDHADAQSVLLQHLEGEALAQPRRIKFTTGKRKQAWNKNVLAIGLSGGFMEPLESTSIHMVYTAIVRLITLFPSRTFSQTDIRTYNRLTDQEYGYIRDFLIAHYKINSRVGEPFWDYCRHMSVPDALQERIDLFSSHGRIIRNGDELFALDSWVQVMHGQGLHPRGYHPLVDQRSEVDIAAFLANVEHVIKACVDVMPSHDEFIAATCAAPKLDRPAPAQVSPQSATN